MSYKPDKLRIEDALIPVVLYELMAQHIEQLPDKDPEPYKKAFELLYPDIQKEINNKKLYKRVSRVKGEIFEWLMQQGWSIPKAYMVMTRLAFQLYQEGRVALGDGAIEVIQDINDIIEEHIQEERILKQDESAVKQAPKLLKFIQQQGYYI